MSKKKENKLDETNKNVLTDDITNSTENGNEPDGNVKPTIINVDPASPVIEPVGKENQNDDENQNEDEKSPAKSGQNKGKVDDEEEIPLKIKLNFTDKYDSSIKYVKGEIHFFKTKRANELLNDKRGLVSKVK